MNIRANQQRYFNLREKHPVFSYKDFYVLHSGTKTEVGFHFESGNRYTFKPRWFFDFGDQTDLFRSLVVDDLFVFHLGMIEMLSYWKAFCSPRIVIEPFQLSLSQQNWWLKLYRYGLGEFFYTNGIPMPGNELLKFEFPGTSAAMPSKSSCLSGYSSRKVLLPVGGGKDSVLSLEMLQDSGYDAVPFVVNPRGATDGVLKAAGCSPGSPVTLKRQMEPLLLQLNTKGFLNGHTPFSAMLAFAALYVAKQMHIQHIALSNESSANEPSVPGTSINHQYSKSLQFERDFREYVWHSLDEQLNYFSLLRPLNELQIGAVFSQLTRYHPVFRSCNAGSKEDRWCGMCSKCLFTCIILAPFLPLGSLKEIFGKELFSDNALKDTLDDLCGISDAKPFECVGTIDEVNIALVAAIDRQTKDEHALPPLLLYYKNSQLYKKYSELSPDDYLCSFDDSHCLGPVWEKLVKNAVCSSGLCAKG